MKYQQLSKEARKANKENRSLKESLDIEREKNVKLESEVKELREKLETITESYEKVKSELEKIQAEKEQFLNEKLFYLQVIEILCIFSNRISNYSRHRWQSLKP